MVLRVDAVALAKSLPAVHLFASVSGITDRNRFHFFAGGWSPPSESEANSAVLLKAS